MRVPGEPALRALIAALHDDLAAREITDADLAAERAAILASWNAPLRTAASCSPHLLPACRHLDAAMAAGRNHPIVSAIAPFLPTLSWRYGYPEHPEWPGLAERLAFAPLIGARAIFTDVAAHLGLTLVAPETHYPLHAHPAIELYLVLSGTAEWRVSGAPFTLQPPGALILHAGGIGHAMRTGAEPLLALYVWRGDLATAPVYVAEDAGPGGAGRASAASN
ncbi:dimethylsulfonioproprionate lyase family protein [Paracraurococcus lichenis]|uniref:Dimethylsulfonioproprionate lyase family protein n=1 Tax=Paracraurococcus lichenis TaxID=3064888 RepID=A0ABT9E5L9_9PROT|nr:dimethylsulfonioproprionate lyase family protein [Paracraurococcus sp. LOR1-02]MDO9711459.1 dimethylsulfonioproprionate lyase family protein [Paracraurococcus sp. LOR1-02]